MLKKIFISILSILIIFSLSACSNNTLFNDDCDLYNNDIINNYFQMYVSDGKSNSYLSTSKFLYNINNKNIYESFSDTNHSVKNLNYFKNTLYYLNESTGNLCCLDENKNEKIIKENIENYVIANNKVYFYKYTDNNKLEILTNKNELYNIPNIDQNKFIFVDLKTLYYIGRDPKNINDDIKSDLIYHYDLKKNKINTEINLKDIKNIKGENLSNYEIVDFNVADNYIYIFIKYSNKILLLKYDLNNKHYTFLNQKYLKDSEDYYSCYYTHKNAYLITKDEDNFYIYKDNLKGKSINKPLITIYNKLGTRGEDLDLLAINKKNILINSRLGQERSHLFLYDYNGKFIEDKIL
ncbi:hypothetical protein [Anaerofustis stercorihominis]|uniref:hypothetical protein n=1 Tax=Anaerofustis stercorihominis TaxID=214853 RepID=UPI00214BFBC0|nr:hypothetical protein [Anaerofustis stercorihominis]MCR2033424.1 hypothetical protein [Anaerofustis stercorihominis]